MPKGLTVVLKGKRINASIEQTIDVIPGESYDITISAAANSWGISPPIKILLEYLDSSGKHINYGIDFSISKGHLANWSNLGTRTFKIIHQDSLKVPEDASFAKLTIIKIALPYTTHVVIDNIVLTRIESSISSSTESVEDIEPDTVTDIEIDVETNPDTFKVDTESTAMVQVSEDTDEYIYVVNKDGVVSIIQSSDKAVIETVDLTRKFSYQENQNIIVSSGGSTISTTHQNSSTTQDYITMIDTSTNALATTIELEGKPITLILTNDSQSNYCLLYVIDPYNRSIRVIDTSTNEVIEDLKLDREYS